MPDNAKGKITEEGLEIIKRLCQEKGVKYNQFIDFYVFCFESKINKLIDDFIEYCECDGWNGYKIEKGGE